MSDSPNHPFKKCTDIWVFQPLGTLHSVFSLNSYFHCMFPVDFYGITCILCFKGIRESRGPTGCLPGLQLGVLPASWGQAGGGHCGLFPLPVGGPWPQACWPQSLPWPCWGRMRARVDPCGKGGQSQAPCSPHLPAHPWGSRSPFLATQSPLRVRW